MFPRKHFCWTRKVGLQQRFCNKSYESFQDCFSVEDILLTHDVHKKAHIYLDNPDLNAADLFMYV